MPGYTPAYERYFRENTTDLFESSKLPRRLAIDRLIEKTIEHWINQEMQDAVRSMQSADKYLKMTDEEFEEI